MSTPNSDRVWFLDTMRYFCVLCVVMIHVCMSQMNFAWDYPVPDPRHLLLADMVVVFTGAFIMPVMFFIAGYFALPSLRPKGAVQFFWAKVRRLLLPGFLVIVLLNPLFGYVYHLVRGFSKDIPPMSYWEFWPHFFDKLFISGIWNPADPPAREFGHWHIWFVPVLFVFFVATAIISSVLGGAATGRDTRTPEPASPKRIVSTLLGTSLFIWLTVTALTRFAPMGWVYLGPFLVFFLQDIPYHICYYSLGVLAYRQRWFQNPASFGSLKPWLVALVVLYGVSFVGWELAIANPKLHAYLPFSLIHSAANVFLCLSFLVVLSVVGMRYFNRPNPIHQNLAANSYRMYLIHFAIVLLLQLAFLQIPSLPGIVVFLSVGVLSLAGTYLGAVVLGGVNGALFAQRTVTQNPSVPAS